MVNMNILWNFDFNQKQLPVDIKLSAVVTKGIDFELAPVAGYNGLIILVSHF